METIARMFVKTIARRFVVRENGHFCVANWKRTQTFVVNAVHTCRLAFHIKQVTSYNKQQAIYIQFWDN